MVKRELKARIEFAVKLSKDSFNTFEEIKESVYKDLERDIRHALKRAGLIKPIVTIR